MISYRRLGVALCVILATPALSLAAVITFDAGVLDNAPVPSPYQGLNWDNFYGMNAVRFTFNPSGFVAGMVSSDFVAYNAFGDPASFSSDTPFDFNSAYLTGGWRDGLNVQVQGFMGPTLAYDQTVVVAATAPTLFNFNYLGVDLVLFMSSGGVDQGYGLSGTHFVMDNMTINESVPEPGTSLLMLAGLGALVALLRRKRTPDLTRPPRP